MDINIHMHLVFLKPGVEKEDIRFNLAYICSKASLITKALGKVS